MSNLFVEIIIKNSLKVLFCSTCTFGCLNIFPGQVPGKCLNPDRVIMEKIREAADSNFNTDDCSVKFKNSFVGVFNFADNEQIESIKVFYQQSDETQPKLQTLSIEEYQSLLSKFNSIQKIGILLKKGNFGVFTNMRTYVTDMYENAYIKSSQSPMFDNQGKQTDRFVSFCVYYQHEIKGVLEEKKELQSNFDDRTNLFKLKIDGSWYYVSGTDYFNSTLNKEVVIKVAGPLSYPE